MRADINIKLEDPLELPIHYNHIIQAVVLRWLSDDNYSKFIHDTGYKYKKRQYKMYTFSKIYGKFSIDYNKKTITYFDNVMLSISSLENEFMKYIINTAIISDVVIGKTRGQVENITFKSLDSINKGRIKTKSPIVVYSTFLLEDKKKTYYYNPKEDEFETIIRNNLIKKYIAYYGSDLNNKEFKIHPLGNLKESIVIYKGTVIKGWNGEFEIEGSPELIKIGYDTGLGSKNSQGFGCFEFVGR